MSQPGLPVKIEDSFLKAVLDASPTMMFVVDGDVRILECNAAALQLFVGGQSPFQRRGGDALQCLQAAAHPDGCGQATACRDCVIRNAVSEAMRGEKSLRKRTVLQIAKDVCTKAAGVICIGSCSAYGNIPAAKPNPGGYKGVGEVLVLLRHALRNAFIPIVTLLGLQSGQLMGGAVLTETVFAWPGLGRLILESITTRDYPIVQAGVLVLSALYLTGNLFVDLLYSYLNPRIRRAGT